MKTKHSFMTKSLSVVLTVVMMITMLSVGFILPETALKASAATYTANSVTSLNTAITNANSAGASVTTTINLSGDISVTGAQASLITITGKVILNFNGHNITFSYSGDGGGSNNSYQLPTANAGSNHGGEYVLTNGMLNVGTSGSLQLINTGSANGEFKVYTYFGSNNNTKQTNQTSSTAIYSKGTVIVGDKSNASNNNVTVFAQSICGTANKDGYKARTSYANAYGITVDDSNNGKFFMYGGTLKSAVTCRGNNDGDLVGRCFSLNLNNCYSAEIYGGEINVVSDNECGHRNSSSLYNTSGGESFFAAIRTCTSNLYIFNVSSTVHAYQGSDTKGSNLRVYNILTNNTAIPHIYGGSFVNTAQVTSGDNGTLCVATLEGQTEQNGYYQIASGTVDAGTAYNASDKRLNFAYTASGKGSKDYNLSWSVFTPMYFGDSKSNSTTTQESASYNDGVYPWSYATFRDYISALSSKNDTYKTKIYSHIGDGESISLLTSTDYRRVGYTQSGWYGSFDVGTENGSVTTGRAAGTLFAYPKWSLNTYTITYNLNDQAYSDSTYTYADSVSQVSGFNTTKTYTIETTNATLGIPVRHGYTFENWTIKAVSYAANDAYSSVKPWGVGVKKTGDTSLNDMYGNLTLEANWKINTYEVTYDMRGGSPAPATISYTVEDAVKIPTVSPTKANYDFEGQWTVSTGAGSWVTGNTYVNGFDNPRGMYGNVTLAPVFTPHEYTVTYDSDGGSNVEDAAAKKYNVESTHTLPAVVKQGFSFVGWKPVAAAGNWNATSTYAPGTAFTNMYGDVLLKAQWEALTFTVDFSLAEGEVFGTTSINYAYDSAVTLTSQPTKTGYTFNGWRVKSQASGGTWGVGTVFTPDAVTGAVTLPANKEGNVVLEATWTPNTYTLSYNTNGGTPVTGRSYTVEDSFTLGSTTKNGYTFKGWTVSSTNGNWTGNYAANAAVSGMYGEITLNAIWETVNYTVTLDANGGSLGTAPATLAYDIESDESERKLPVPEKTGYDFAGWTVSATDTVGSSWAVGEDYNDYLPAGKYGNATVKANWTAKSYTIRFNTIGTAVTDKSYTIGDSAFTLPSASCPGYTFNYWEVENAAGNWAAGAKFYTTDSISAKYGDVVLKAVFTPDTYNLVYSYADGTSKTVTYNITDSLTLETYTYGGYTFGGWEVSECVGGNWYAGAQIPAGAVEAGQYGDVTLTPVLEANTYSITFNSDGGTAYANRSYKITDETALPTPEKTGYNFAGWKVTSAAGNWVANSVTALGATVNGKWGNVTLTAQWSAKNYTITWVTGSGTFTTQAPYGSTPSFSGKTTKAADEQYYYTFNGTWSPAISAVTGDTTYTAQYDKSLRDYTVTWVVETDETNTSTTQFVYYYGETPVYNYGVNPVKASSDSADHVWRFTGWDKAVTPVNGNVTYTAQFKRVAAPRSVTWIIDGVSTVSSYEVGETPDYGTTPYKAAANGYAYEFVTWTPSIVPVAANTDYTYTAQFNAVPKTYTATFDANGGTIYANEAEYNLVDGLTLPTPTRNGYDFTGWKVTTAQGTWVADTTYDGGEEITGKWGNVKFTAQWELAQFTVTYSAAEGTAPAAQTYTIESTAVIEACTREGYEMTAYIVSAGTGSWTMGTSVAVGTALTGKYGNVTLTPIWYPRTYTITWVSGTTVQTTDVLYGDSIAAIDPIAKTGYNAQWDAEIPATMPANDLTFNAVYSLINYNVRVNVNGGSAVDNFTYNIESTATLPAPTRSGSTFDGWRITIAAGNWTKNALVPAGTSLGGKYGNITITAEWTLETHTVTFVAGDITKETLWYHGSIPFYSGTPVKASDALNSYVFDKWDKEFTEVTEDVVYTAIFKPVERVYTVTWNVDNDIITETYKYGETPVYPGETPVKASTELYDFTFAGWDKEITAVTEDATYIVEWNIFTKLRALTLDVSAVILQVGESGKLTAKVYPTTASVKDVVWKSQNESIVSVDSEGNITANKSGPALVRVSSVDGNFNAYCMVMVERVHTKTVVISSNGVSTTNLPGTAVQLYATLTPDNATFTDMFWSSSDPSIASVDDNGLVTYNRVGKAVITCRTDGYAAGEIEVVVTEDQTLVVDEVKTYLVMFQGVASAFVIDGVKYNKINVRVEEGGSVQFKLQTSCCVLVNGELLKKDSDGYYRISDIHQNYNVITSETSYDIPDEDEVPGGNSKLSFFERISAFFRQIVLFFRKLFGQA